MKRSICLVSVLLLIGCNNHNEEVSQINRQPTALVGGGCEGCELMFVGMPKEVSAESESLGWSEGAQKLVVRGKVLQPDGKPAPGVIIYYWHTNDEGRYAPDEHTPPEAREHGKLRGWVKSGADGKYLIRTSRPAAYPSQDIPQHIHLSIQEPKIANPYFADLYFEDDPLYQRHQQQKGRSDRAGNEVLKTHREADVQISEHNILLGQNIPNYPTTP